MRKGIQVSRKTVLWAAAWGGICFVSALLLRAILWGAEPGAGLMTHLRYGMAYALSGNRKELLELLLLSAAVGWAGAAAGRNNRGIFWPGIALALLFSLNTLIAMSPTGRLQGLIAFPGAGGTENLLFWLTQLGSWYAVTLVFCRRMAAPVSREQTETSLAKCRWIWAAVMAICWLPILILRSPGSVFRDTDAQILQFMGQLPFEASNPLILSFVYGPLFCLGRLLGSDNIGLFLCVLFQLALTLYAFSFACREAAAARGSLAFGWALCLFFGIAPNYASMVSAVLKDSVHAPLYLLFFLYYRRAMTSNAKRDWIWLAALAVLVSATRKGAVYLAALSLLGLLLLRQDRKRSVIMGTCLLLAGHFLLNSLLYPALGVEKPMEKENYSFFYPITGYYCEQHEQELTQEEKDIIGSVLDYNTVCTGFSPRSVDTIKETFHAESKAQIRAYLALHARFLLRHPLTCLEALVYSRNYYFTPWSVRGERITVSMSAFSEVKEGAESCFSYWLPENLRQNAEDHLWTLTDRTPIRELSSPGTYTWLCLLLLAAAAYRRDRREKIMLLPLVLLTAGLLLTHLNGAIRYTSPLLYCVPTAAMLGHKHGETE